MFYSIFGRTKPLGLQARLTPDSFEEPFLVLNGDVLTRLDLGQLLGFIYSTKLRLLLCAHETTVPFGVVQTEGVN